MPGEVTRRGPAKATGLARSDQTGSVRMLRPAIWTRSVAWPTMVTRSPSTRASGVTGVTSTDEGNRLRSEEHTSELQSLMRISYAVFCLKKKKPYRTYQKVSTKQQNK